MVIIHKTAVNKENYKICDYYYNSAREGMFDLLHKMSNDNLVKTIFLPGYIGWSPKEGSGIFDPINKLKNVSVVYYPIHGNLSIDYKSLFKKIDKLNNRQFAVLIVNYFGFIDINIEKIYLKIKERKGWIIEDNAHGFFTHLYKSHSPADAIIFSLHKMFPFEEGGSLRILNDNLKKYKFNGKESYEITEDPFKYDLLNISITRRSNYEKIDKLVKQRKYSSLFKPLKDNLSDNIIPQTYPVIIMVGNRDKIFELMNESGYGVVSLYHTLIEPLRNKEHAAAVGLSKKILNLPVHQDVDTNKYEEMLELLSRFCMDTI